MKQSFLIISSFVSVIITSCGPDNVKIPETEVIVRDSITKVDQLPYGDTLVSQVNSDTIAVNYNILAGDWIRLDGGYVMRIKNVAERGALLVEYFNPNSINVSKSYWETEGSNLFVMVELRDVNYPGSTYMLQYFPQQDKLAGNYFQAAEGNNYDVVFERKK